MYKQRITKWGLDKKTKEDEAWAILRLNMRRELLGKDSAFRVRGKPVTMDDTLRYFKRKGIINPNPTYPQMRARTPPGIRIECWTPPSTPKPVATSYDSAQRDVAAESEEANVLDVAVFYLQNTDADAFRYFGFDETRQILFEESEFRSNEIPESLLPPQILLVSEKLLASIKTYYIGAFEQGLFVTDKRGELVHADDALVGEYHMNFEDLCITGLGLMNRGLFIEGRRCFSKALSIIFNVIQSQDPRALTFLFNSLLCTVQDGYSEITDILQVSFRSWAIQKLESGHPWVETFSQICDLNISHFESTLTEVQRCICDTLVNFLESFTGRAYMNTAHSLFHMVVQMLHIFSKVFWRMENSNSAILTIVYIKSGML